MDHTLCFRLHVSWGFWSLGNSRWYGIWLLFYAVSNHLRHVNAILSWGPHTQDSTWTEVQGFALLRSIFLEMRRSDFQWIRAEAEPRESNMCFVFKNSDGFQSDSVGLLTFWKIGSMLVMSNHVGVSHYQLYAFLKLLGIYTASGWNWLQRNTVQASGGGKELFVSYELGSLQHSHWSSESLDV